MEDWRDRDPVEDRYYRQLNPELQTVEIETVRQKIQELHQDLDRDGVPILVEMMQTVAQMNQVRKKAERIEQRLDE